MMTKKESKQIKQLKYLLLIPVLASMLAYTSCSQDASATAPEQKKDNTVLYTDIKEIKKRVSETKQSYMDVFLGLEPPKTKELQLNDLTNVELIELNNKKEQYEKSGKDIPLRIFEGIENKKRKIIFLDLEEVVRRDGKKEQTNEYKNSSYVPFTLLDKYPTYPGCNEGDRNCFTKSITRFVANNFDVSKANNLGIKKGRARVYVQFKVDKTGKVTQVKARAPHAELKQYAKEVIEKLPRMKPGEKDGKVVSTGYTIPITLNIE